MDWHFCKEQKWYLMFCLLILQSAAFAQNAQYFIQFTDKNNSPYAVNRPLEFLSQRAVERRLRQKILVTTRDLPVNPAYVQGVKSAGAKVWYTSRWMNGALIEADLAVIDAVRQLPFVKPLSTEEKVAQALDRGLAGSGLQEAGGGTQSNKAFETPTPSQYGGSATQLNMMGVNIMHTQGFTGKGIQIAVLDGGFRNVNVLPFFNQLVNEKRILGTYDFVDHEDSVYEDEAHGMQVLSAMAALQPGELIGPAYDASFWLLRTENGNSEYRIEEVNWLLGAEFADSVGVDILHSSLGYNTFDDPAMDYQPKDMDGDTPFVTQAADMAAATGMLVVTSAGNEGDNTWRTITAPADGDSVLAVGAVDQRGGRAAFSSFGPSADGRVKPNVSALGQGTVLGRADGSIGTSSGTSFSAPLVSGLAAGLWQAFPQLTNQEIISYLQRSASQANQPDSLLGYGIPNFSKAFQLAQRDKGTNQPLGYLSPNPLRDETLMLWLNVRALNGPLTLQFFDASGHAVGEQYIPQPTYQNKINLTTATLRKGLYLVRLSSSGQQLTLKLIKW